MPDGSQVSPDTEYESESTAGREEIAATLMDVSDGVLMGAIQLGTGEDAVSVTLPEELSLEIEFEADDDEMSLELELEWPTPEEGNATSTSEAQPGETEDPPHLTGSGGSESLARFEVFEDERKEWRWRLRHRNGDIIASSGEGYTQKHNAMNGLRSVIKNSPAAEIQEQPRE